MEDEEEEEEEEEGFSVEDFKDFELFLCVAVEKQIVVWKGLLLS